MQPLTQTSECTPLHQNSSTAPTVPTDHSTTRSMNLKNDDHAFVNIAMALLERHRTKNLSAQDAVDSVLLPHERKAFSEAVAFRKAQLPIFPVAHEDPNNQVVRDVEQLFGTVLRSSQTTMTSHALPKNFAFDSGSPASHLKSTTVLSSPAAQQRVPQSHADTPQRTPTPLPIASSATAKSPSPQHDMYFSPSNREAPQLSQQPGHLHAINQMPAQINVPLYQQVSQNSLQVPYQEQHKYHPAQPSNDEFPAAMSGLHVDNFHSSNRSSPAASSLSVETQPIQNLSHRDSIHPMHFQSQYRQHQQQRQHQQPSISAYNGMGTPNQFYDTTGTMSPPMMQGATPPRYKQFRPPALHIQQPSPVPVTSPPTHIDIDWNILVETVNNGIPNSTTDQMNHGFRDSTDKDQFHESSDKIQLQQGRDLDTVRSPDWAPLSETVLTSGAAEKEGKNRPKSHSSTVLARQDDDYLLDIARNRYLLSFDEAEATQKGMELRKKLLEEIDRVSFTLQQHQQQARNAAAATAASTTGDGAAQGTLDEKMRAYESYRVELRMELEKWNRVSSEFANRPSSDARSKSSDVKPDLACRRDSDHESSRIKGSGKTGIGDRGRDDPKKKPLLAKTIDNNDPFAISRKQLRMMKVMAPSTLPEGFQFEARCGDEHFVATVPPGGVAKGEVFLTSMGDALGDDAGSGAGANQRTRIFRDMDAPPSRWRDELFDCFRHGLFHDFLWNSVCCPLIAISQIMARIQLSDTGDPVITIKSRTRVGWYVFLVLLLIAIHAACACFLILTKPDEETILMAAIPLAGLDVILILYFLYMVVQTRKNVRREYGIPELRCHGHEDCCLAVFCTCCTIAQMGRHTADYETYQSHCCTDTGLANHVEVKLPCESLVDMEQGVSNDPREYSTYRLI